MRTTKLAQAAVSRLDALRVAKRRALLAVTEPQARASVDALSDPGGNLARERALERASNHDPQARVLALGFLGPSLWQSGRLGGHSLYGRRLASTSWIAVAAALRRCDGARSSTIHARTRRSPRPPARMSAPHNRVAPASSTESIAPSHAPGRSRFSTRHSARFLTQSSVVAPAAVLRARLQAETQFHESLPPESAYSRQTSATALRLEPPANA